MTRKGKVRFGPKRIWHNTIRHAVFSGRRSSVLLGRFVLMSH